MCEFRVRGAYIYVRTCTEFDLFISSYIICLMLYYNDFFFFKLYGSPQRIGCFSQSHYCIHYARCNNDAPPWIRAASLCCTITSRPTAQPILESWKRDGRFWPRTTRDRIYAYDDVSTNSSGPIAVQKQIVRKRFDYIKLHRLNVAKLTTKRIITGVPSCACSVLSLRWTKKIFIEKNAYLFSFFFFHSGPFCVPRDLKSGS